MPQSCRCRDLSGTADCCNKWRWHAELLSLRFKDAPGTFARVGKRYILNLSYIYRINTLKQELTLSDQRTFIHTLSLSKVALKALKDLIAPQPKTESK